MNTQLLTVIFLLGVSMHSVTSCGNHYSEQNFAEQTYKNCVEDIYYKNAHKLKDLTPDNYSEFSKKREQVVDVTAFEWFKCPQRNQFVIMQEVAKKFKDAQQPLAAALVHKYAEKYLQKEKLMFIEDRTEGFRKRVIQDLGKQFVKIFTDANIAHLHPNGEITKALFNSSVIIADQVANPVDGEPHVQQREKVFKDQVDVAAQLHFGGNSAEVLTKLEYHLFETYDNPLLYGYINRARTMLEQDQYAAYIAQQANEVEEAKKKSKEVNVSHVGGAFALGGVIGAAGLYGILKHLGKFEPKN